MIMWNFSHYEVFRNCRHFCTTSLLDKSVFSPHFMQLRKNKPNEGSLSGQFTMVQLQNGDELLLPYQAYAIHPRSLKLLQLATLSDFEALGSFPPSMYIIQLEFPRWDSRGQGKTKIYHRAPVSCTKFIPKVSSQKM